MHRNERSCIDEEEHRRNLRRSIEGIIGRKLHEIETMYRGLARMLETDGTQDDRDNIALLTDRLPEVRELYPWEP